MNRLNLVHTGARVDLPASFGDTDQPAKPSRPSIVRPATAFYLAIAGFMGCGAAVIATTSFIALQIR